jgi:hypothetical protein
MCTNKEEKNKMKRKTKRGKVIIVAFIVAMVALGSAQAGLDVQKGINFFMLLSYITLGLSLLLAALAFFYLMMKRRKKEEVKAEVAESDKAAEIMKAIKELKELKKKIEERGESLTSISDVFLAQVLILSKVGSINKGIEGIKKEMDNTTSLVLFELEVLVAFCLALLSMLFVIMSMV